MSWGSLSEFLAMGGYAPYVWGSYAVCAGLIAAEIAAVRARKRRALEQLDELHGAPAAGGSR
jgi:heme exporter protein D